MRFDRLARSVVRLYPRVWRQRYETELLALLDDSPAGWQTVVDLTGSCIREWTLAFSVWILAVLRQPSPPKTWAPYFVWPIVGFAVSIPAVVAANFAWSAVAMLLLRFGFQPSLAVLLCTHLALSGFGILAAYDAWNLKILPRPVVIAAIILLGGMFRCGDFVRSHADASLGRELFSWTYPATFVLLAIMLWLRRSLGGLSAMPPEWRSAGLTMLRLTGRDEKDKQA